MLPRYYIQAHFEKFHELNPHVYAQLVRWARRLKARGHKQCGIAMLFEILRWQHMMTQDPGSPFKLNNDYRSRYARLIMEREPDLEGFFKLRDLANVI